MHEHVASGAKIFRCRRLRLIVAEAALARHEDHGDRRYIPDIHRIVASARENLARGQSELNRGFAYGIDTVWIEVDLRHIRYDARIKFKFVLLGNFLQKGLDFSMHFGEGPFLRMPDIDGKFDAAWNGIPGIRRDHDFADRADRFRCKC